MAAAKRATPDAVVARLNAAFNEAMRVPFVQARLAELSIQPGGGTLGDAGSFITQEAAAWGQLIRARGIRAN